MKLMRVGDPGQEKPGLLDDQGVIRDLSDHVDDIAGEVLSPAGLDRLRSLDLSQLPTLDADARVGPCVGRVGKFVCIGLNYSDHAAEAGMAIPEEPIVFGKWTSAICGPNDDIRIPRALVKPTGKWNSGW